MEGTAGWSRGQEERARPGARGREERKEREREREGERKEKKRERKWEKKKRKWKKRNGGRKRGGERWIRAGITALIAEPVGHAWRPGARERDARARGETGMGPREIWMSARFLGVSGI